LKVAAPLLAILGLLPQRTGLESRCFASGLKPVGESAEGTGRGTNGLRDGQLLHELTYFLIGHLTLAYGDRRAAVQPFVCPGANVAKRSRRAQIAAAYSRSPAASRASLGSR